ncbi:unnamed protein product [Gordionus sp. m RMFG-2023]
MKDPLALRYYADMPVYTDASNSHIGICIWEIELKSISYNEASLLFNIPSHAIQHINAKEDLAAGMGAILALSSGQRPMIFTDSTVTYYSYKKDGSRSPSIEIVITQVLEKIGLTHFTSLSQNIQWIPSEDNPADEPPRVWMAQREHLDLFGDRILTGQLTLQQEETSLFGVESSVSTPSLLSNLPSMNTTISYHWDQISINSTDLLN